MLTSTGPKSVSANGTNRLMRSRHAPCELDCKDEVQIVRGRQDAHCGLSDVEHPHDTGERAGQSGQNDERVEPRLEIDDQQEVDQQHSEEQPEGKTVRIAA
jgi:hypothetical protein